MYSIVEKQVATWGTSVHPSMVGGLVDGLIGGPVGGAVGGLVGGLIGGAVGSLSRMPPPQWEQLILAVDSIPFWSLPTHRQYVQLVPLQFVPEDYKQ